MKNYIAMLTDKKVRLAALLVVTAFSVAVSGTLCYFMAATAGIENRFFPARLTIEIHETFTKNDENEYVKSNVSFENVEIPGATSNAYIRARLVPSWRDADGHVAGVPATLDMPGAVTSVINEDLSFDEIGGYYYYKGILDPGEQTPVLIRSLTVDYSALAGTVYEGLAFELTVLAEGLNASPGAAEATWGMSYNEAYATWSPAAP